MAQALDAAAHVAEPLAKRADFSRRQAFEKRPVRSPQRQIMLTRETGEFRTVLRGARPVASHQFEHRRVQFRIRRACRYAPRSRAARSRRQRGKPRARPFPAATTQAPDRPSPRRRRLVRSERPDRRRGRVGTKRARVPIHAGLDIFAGEPVSRAVRPDARRRPRANRVSPRRRRGRPQHAFASTADRPARSCRPTSRNQPPTALAHPCRRKPTCGLWRRPPLFPARPWPRAAMSALP